MSSKSRFLVRLRLDLLLPGGNAHRNARRQSRCRRALPAVPAGADLQGAGLGYLAVQSLRGEGPPHVARPRAAVRRPLPAVPTAGTVSTEQSVGGARGAGRAGRRLGRRILPCGISGRVRRGTQDRRAGNYRCHSRGPAARRRQGAVGGADGRQPKYVCGSRPSRPSSAAFSAPRPLLPRTANCSGATIGWSARCDGPRRGAD